MTAEQPISTKQLRAMLRAQDYASALPILDALIAKDPHNAPAHWHRATCLLACARREEARDAIRRVLAINPDYAPAKLKLAELAADLHVSPAKRETEPHPVKSLDEVLARFASDDPWDKQASTIAFQIHRLSNEAPPNYVASKLDDYPQYQRAFAQHALEKMDQAGFALVGDFEPLHLRETLGSPTLVRVYTGDQGAIFAASYRLAPQWPGLLGFLRLWFGGLWKKPAVIELQSAIGDGQFIVTNNSGSANPFTYGSAIAVEKMPLGTKIEAVVKRHRARLAEYLGIHHKEQVLRATSMAGIVPLLTQLATAKNQYRKSIGYINDAELRQLLGRHYAQLAERVRARVAVIG